MILTTLQKYIHRYRIELLVVVFFLFLTLFIPKASFDWASYVVWAQYIQEHGLSNIYQLHYVNYMPLNIFAIHLWQVGVEKLGYELVDKVHWLKLYPMFFDCLTICVSLRFARRMQFPTGLAAAVLLLNVAFHYNSYVWGQFDSIYTFFSLLSLLLVYQKKYTYAAISYLLALNVKLQAIIFLPLLLFLALLQSGQEDTKMPTHRVLARGLAAAIGLLGVQWLLFIPFRPHTVQDILAVIWERSSALSSYVTFNADNFWLIVGAQSMITQDTSAWVLGIPYRVWGALLFFIFSGAVLLSLAWDSVALLYARSRVRMHSSLKELQLEFTILAAYLISLQFFFFLTQMHERYAHPAVIFATLYYFVTRRPGLLALTSLAYLINMERLLEFWWFTTWIGQWAALDMVAAWMYTAAWFYAVFLFSRGVQRTVYKLQN